MSRVRSAVLALATSIACLSPAACDRDAGSVPATAQGAVFEVVATSAGERPIEAIKAIRAVTGLGLKDSKELADDVPSVILSGVTESAAKTAAAVLRDAGVTVQVRRE